jgi:transposase
MIRGGFLPSEDRTDLIALARDGSVAHRLGRRANALVLLDDGLSCEAVAKLLFVDDDTIRSWRQLYEEDGLEGLTRFEAGGSACQLSGEQQETLKAWVHATLPRTTREVGAWIEKEFGAVYESRSGLIALLHRLGLEYHKADVIPRKLDGSDIALNLGSEDRRKPWRRCSLNRSRQEGTLGQSWLAMAQKSWSTPRKQYPRTSSRDTRRPHLWKYPGSKNSGKEVPRQRNLVVALSPP